MKSGRVLSIRTLSLWGEGVVCLPSGGCVCQPRRSLNVHVGHFHLIGGSIINSISSASFLLLGGRKFQASNHGLMILLIRPHPEVIWEPIRNCILEQRTLLLPENSKGFRNSVRDLG